MISRFFRITGILFTVAAWMSTTCAGLNAAQIEHPATGQKVYLKCTLEIETSKVGSHDIVTYAISIKNPTSSAIPKDAAIHWSVNASTNGSFKLPSPIAPGGSTRKQVLIHGGCPYQPQAWYFKTAQSNSNDTEIQAIPPNPVSLQCTIKMGMEGPAAYFALSIKNTTSIPILQGTTILWSLNASTKGSFKLKYALPPGGSIDEKLQGLPPAYPTPKAWYFK